MSYCPKCGGKLNQMGHCPACTAPQPVKKKSKKTLWLIIGLVAVLVLTASAILLGFYLGADKKPSAQNEAAAIVAGHELSAAQINFWLMDIYSSEADGSIDPEIPLYEQSCPKDGYETWYDYYLHRGLYQAASYYVAYDAAMEEGFVLSEAMQSELNSRIDAATEAASRYGYPDVNKLLEDSYGPGCDLAGYREYLTVLYIGNEYSMSKSHVAISQQDVDAYYAEHSDALDYVRFRVFNVEAEATTDAEGKTVYSEEALAAAEEDAIAMAEAVKNGGEEAFFTEALARTPEEKKATFDPDSDTLQQFMTRADAAATYDAWFAKEGRAYGDVLPLSNDTGFFVIFYMGHISKDTAFPNVRHILIIPETAEDGTTSPEAWEAARLEAEAILGEYLAGDQTEESFAALADSKSADTGSVGNGGLYEEIRPMQMVAPFANWCYSEHEVGDTGIVKTAYGYHVMYFSSNSEMTYGRYLAETALGDDAFSVWSTSISEKIDYTILSEEGIIRF